VSTPLAPHVLSGGFEAVLYGGTLKVSLVTYYTTSQGSVSTVSGDVTVTLRN
jgi:hypothetical protein